jgi:hypothetical protein
MENLVNWKDMFITEPNGAQLTYAQTISQAVVNAICKQPWPEPGVW